MVIINWNSDLAKLSVKICDALFYYNNSDDKRSPFHNHSIAKEREIE